MIRHDQSHFFLAGAPKCGTSSLYSWLNLHPRVVGSHVKEPFYFMDRDNPLMDAKCNVHLQGAKGWAQLFDGHKVEADSLLFEATTHLMYQRVALQILPSLSARPKFIFLLRDPVNRLRSSYEYTRENLGRMRMELTLEHWLQMLIKERSEEVLRYVSHSSSAYVLQRDLEYGDYARYLKDWLQQLGPDRMLVLQLEALQASPQDCMARVCEFLAIDAEPFNVSFDFARRNATQAIRFHGLQRWARSLGSRLPSGRLKGALKRGYQSVQTVSGQSSAGRSTSALSHEMLAHLRDYYAPGKQWLVENFSFNPDLWR